MTAALRFGLLLPVVGKVIIRQVQVILMQRTFNFLHFAEFFSRDAASYEHLMKFLNPSVLAVWFAMLSFKSGCSTLRGIPLKLVNLNVLRCFSKSSIDSLASLLFQVGTSYLLWVQVTCHGYKFTCHEQILLTMVISYLPWVQVTCYGYKLPRYHE